MSGEVISLPLVFLAGVVSFASPCFLPIVPVFAAYLSGSAREDKYARLAVGSGNGFITAQDHARSSAKGLFQITEGSTRLAAASTRVLLSRLFPLCSSASGSWWQQLAG